MGVNHVTLTSVGMQRIALEMAIGVRIQVRTHARTRVHARTHVVATCMPHICGVGYLMPTIAGVVQRRLLFVVVVQARCAVVLLFLFEHFGTVTARFDAEHSFGLQIGRFILLFSCQ